MRRWFLAFFLTLIYLATYAQTTLSGSVTDAATGKALPNAIVTVQKLRTEQILGYAVAKAGGAFAITVNSPADSLTLQVKLLGYAPFRRHVRNQTAAYSPALTQAATELKELHVKPDPVRKYGDTLTYRVSEFKSKEDRVIADVIKKLPGIEVKDNGQILYQGEPINKYYIEGMDLLEGRYKLANDNLNVDAVTSVEVMENHQPVRMLDGKVFSEKAALNIRLKKSITTSGQGIVGSGLAPWLYDANFTPMLFTKKRQALVTYQGNNTGRNSANQLIRFTGGMFRGELPFEPKTDWLGIQRLSPPGFKDTRWLDNQLHMGSVNLLNVLKKGTELRLQADYTHDWQRQLGLTRTTYFNAAEDIQLLEDKTNRLLFHNLKAEVALQQNTKQKFLKNILQFRGFWDSQTGVIQNNQTQLTQQVSSPYFALRNDFRDIIPVKNKLLIIHSDTRLELVPQRLGVSGSQLGGIYPLGSPVEQQLLQTGFSTDNSLQFTTKWKAIGFDLQPGVSVERKRFETQMPPPATGQPADFRNDLVWLKQKYYLDLQARWKWKSMQWGMGVPLTYYRVEAADNQLSKAEKLAKPVVEPRLNVAWEISGFWKLIGSSSYTFQVGTLEQLYFGYLLTNYRTLQRNAATLRQARGWNNLLRLEYRNPITTLFANANYSYTILDANLLYKSNLAANGTIERTAVALPNRAVLQNGGGKFGKYVSAIKSNFAVGVNYSHSRNVQLINDNLTEATNLSILPTMELRSNFSDKINGQYSYTYIFLRSALAAAPRLPVAMQTHEASLNFFPMKNSYVGVVGEWYINNTRRQQSVFLDLLLRQTVGKRKIDLEAQLTNLLNTSRYVEFSNGPFSYIETSYLLRPRQLLLKTRFRF